MMIFVPPTVQRKSSAPKLNALSQTPTPTYARPIDDRLVDIQKPVNKPLEPEPVFAPWTKYVLVALLMLGLYFVSNHKFQLYHLLVAIPLFKNKKKSKEQA